MNIIRKVVKETLLLPVRVVQGTVDAVSETLDIIEDKPKPKEERR